VGHLSTNYLEEISAFAKEHEPNKSKYVLVLRFYTSWIFQNGNFRTKDISNYIKLTEDVVKQVTGVDDSSYWMLIVEKIDYKSEDEDKGHVEIFLYKRENEILVSNYFKEKEGKP
jgi:hypothetical protein